jgi:hypothetical protein
MGKANLMGMLFCRYLKKMIGIATRYQKTALDGKGLAGLTAEVIRAESNPIIQQQ